MNPLQERPNIFANGEFQVKHQNKIYQIFGYKIHKGLFVDPTYISFNDGWIEPEHVTLVARSIADMSEEEKERYESLKVNVDGEYVDTFESVDYALSIGVYPFDQKR